jgi:hypothetical protein
MGSTSSQATPTTTQPPQEIKKQLYLVGVISIQDIQSSGSAKVDLVISEDHHDQALKNSIYAHSCHRVFAFPIDAQLKSVDEKKELINMIKTWGTSEDLASWVILDRTTLGQLGYISNEAIKGEFSVTPYLLNMKDWRVQGDYKLHANMREDRKVFPHLFPTFKWPSCS